MAIYKLYLVSKKTGKSEMVFRSDNSDDCFKYMEAFEKTDYFKKKYYKGNFAIMSVPDGTNDSEVRHEK